MRAALGLADDVDALSPVELIRAILLAPVDLLFNGGIGTYVKAADRERTSRSATRPTTPSGSTASSCGCGWWGRAATSG